MKGLVRATCTVVLCAVAFANVSRGMDRCWCRERVRSEFSGGLTRALLLCLFAKQSLFQDETNCPMPTWMSRSFSYKRITPYFDTLLRLCWRRMKKWSDD